VCVREREREREREGERERGREREREGEERGGVEPAEVVGGIVAEVGDAHDGVPDHVYIYI
jgi:hypothetical protein